MKLAEGNQSEAHEGALPFLFKAGSWSSQVLLGPSRLFITILILSCHEIF